MANLFLTLLCLVLIAAMSTFVGSTLISLSVFAGNALISLINYILHIPFLVFDHFLKLLLTGTGYLLKFLLITSLVAIASVVWTETDRDRKVKKMEDIGFALFKTSEGHKEIFPFCFQNKDNIQAYLVSLPSNLDSKAYSVSIKTDSFNIDNLMIPSENHTHFQIYNNIGSMLRRYSSVKKSMKIMRKQEEGLRVKAYAVTTEREVKPTTSDYETVVSSIEGLIKDGEQTLNDLRYAIRDCLIDIEFNLLDDNLNSEFLQALTVLRDVSSAEEFRDELSQSSNEAINKADAYLKAILHV